jgi:hypothetical protein
LYRTYSDLCRDFNATFGVWQSLQAKVEVDAVLKHADHGPGIDSATVTAGSSAFCEPASQRSGD